MFHFIKNSSNNFLKYPIIFNLLNISFYLSSKNIPLIKKNIRILTNIFVNIYPKNSNYHRYLKF